MLRVNILSYEGLLVRIDPIYQDGSGRNSCGKLHAEIPFYKITFIDCNGIEVEVTAKQEDISISHE